ncbi:5'-nucleotidase C-terminal domain-containing protein [Peptoniphilus mikwangii]|uniref:5'-nucleotidase C-terminal domain-containing protein n=1 Tax=Peptoniphilus mikwangii TaxID=1354300 RepID=UPI00042684F9|nr:5'-nucleotidase C-terminal domain-containing protein [Peptoniphilus mikwangii]
MKNKRRYLSLVLTLVLVFSTFTGVFAKEVEDSVVKLQEVKLLDKENNTEAKLHSDLTRAEGLTMVLKAIGYSQEVAEGEKYVKLNPFKDVADWFKGYAGLGYDLNLTKGKSEDAYDPNSNLSKREFIAFILRALDYNKDKAYKDADQIGKKIGLLSADDDINSKITKAQAAKYIFSALNKELQDGTGYTLGEYLVKTKVVSEEKAKEVGIVLGAKDDKSINILYFNDFHGNIAEEITGKKRNMGMAKMVGYVNEFIEKHPNTIVLSGGDNYQGTADSNLTMGKPVTAMMKGMNTTASAVGNHEFDWGSDKIADWGKNGNFDYLASNIYDTAKNTPVDWAKPYMIIQKGNIKIGLIGLAHPDTPTLTKAEYVKGFEFRDPVKSAQEWVNFLQEGKAKEGKPDVIIALTHIDSDQSKTGEITGNATKLATEVKGLDCILSAHSHRTVSGKVNGVPILQAYCYGRAIGQVNIKVDNGKVSSIDTQIFQGNQIKDKIIVDTQTDKFYSDLQKELAPIKGEVLGEAKGEFTHDRSAKGTVSLLGRWACEVMAEKTNAQIGIQNGGGLRRTLNAGKITMGDLYEIMPFDNYLVVMDLPGDALIKAIDHGINMPETTDGAFSGLKVEYDASKPYEQRITKITLTDGTPIDPQKTYKVVVNDFMFTGGDGYDFTKAQNVNETYIPIRDVLVESIKQSKTITPKAIDFILDVTSAKKAA